MGEKEQLRRIFISRPAPWEPRGPSLRSLAMATSIVAFLGLAGLYRRGGGDADFSYRTSQDAPIVPGGDAPVAAAQSPAQVALANAGNSPYGQFPQPNDPFHFMPCTNKTVQPLLSDTDPEKSWAALFDPDPSHWSWTNRTSSNDTDLDGEYAPPVAPPTDDPYAGRGIYLCGYLDVPLDYDNKTEKRIVRLAVTKLQVSGLARNGTTAPEPSTDGGKPAPGTKSSRTIVIEPGGPGGSGTSYTWRAGFDISKRLSQGTFDVLGWDPRGVNATQPAIACFPYDANRDRWALLTGRYRAASGTDPRMQLEVADAMFNATFAACRRRHGDLARFVGTGLVAHDMEEIRKALGEEELTGYLVSYGTGIGQTYANLFPQSVGRMILDGTEYVRDHRELGGFGWTALDNATDAWRDGFLGECLKAGPEKCALAKSKDGKPVVLEELMGRVGGVIESLIDRPLPAYTNKSGPSLVTYSSLVGAIYGSLYNAKSWPALARMLSELEDGNTTLAGAMLERSAWEYDPSLPTSLSVTKKPSSDELTFLVICADSYDAPQPVDGLDWWDALWANMTAKSWVSGDSRLFDVLPCRHFATHWPEPPVGVFRGDLNATLKNPVLLIAETYDPATPLRNGRRLAQEMGTNARLIAHHGYGHSSRDTSNCTDEIARTFIMTGALPVEAETACFADEKPYLYAAKGANSTRAKAKGVEDGSERDREDEEDVLGLWREHMRELAMWAPNLLP